MPNSNSYFNFQDRNPNRKSRQDLVRKRQENKVEQELRKIGLEKMKTGAHSQMWRVEAITGARKKVEGIFAQLGAMGELGEDVCTYIELNLSVLNTLNGMGFNLSYSEVELSCLTIAVKPIIDYLHAWVDIWVPLDTGALRSSLHTAVNETTLTFPFRCVLSTKGISYASVVNKMPTVSLRKSGKAPRARTGWYNLLLLNARVKAKLAFRKMVSNVGSKLDPILAKEIFNNRNRYNIARSLFAFSEL